MEKTVTLHAYRARNIQFREYFEHEDWKFKLYTITPHNGPFPVDLLARAKAFAATVLPPDAFYPDRYGLGFIIVHEGMDGNYILINWWQGENMLCSLVYGSEAAGSQGFKSLQSTGISACVWEMEVFYAERNAWIATALSGEGDDWEERYMAQLFRQNENDRVR